jgi:hypothetical protein
LSQSRKWGYYKTFGAMNSLAHELLREVGGHSLPIFSLSQQQWVQHVGVSTGNGDMLHWCSNTPHSVPSAWNQVLYELLRRIEQANTK